MAWTQQREQSWGVLLVVGEVPAERLLLQMVEEAQKTRVGTAVARLEEEEEVEQTVGVVEVAPAQAVRTDALMLLF